MAKSYLHKQTILIAIICIMAVGGTALYVYSEPAPQIPQSVAINSAEINTNIVATSSTDWKKQFFDSSGSNAITGKTAIDTTASNTPSTLTNQMGLDLFSRYFELKQNNLDGNKQLVQDTIDQTIANAQVAAAKPKQYTASDLIISNDASAQNLKKYGNIIGSIFIQYSPKQSPADVANTAFTQNDMSILSQIDPIIDSYKKISNFLIATPVPQPLATDQLNLVNGINSMILVSQGLRNIEGDPAQSLISLGNYGDAQNTMINALLNIQAYMNTNHITFASTEPGSFISLLQPQ